LLAEEGRGREEVFVPVKIEKMALVRLRGALIAAQEAFVSDLSTRKRAEKKKKEPKTGGGGFYRTGGGRMNKGELRASGLDEGGAGPSHVKGGRHIVKKRRFFLECEKSPGQ